MIIILLIGLLLLGAAVAIAMRAVALPHLDAAERLGQIRSYGFGEEPVPATPPPAGLGSALDQTASRVGRFAATHFGKFREDEIRAQLTMAGLYRTSPLTFLGYRVLCAVLVPTVFIWWSSTHGSAPTFIVLGTIFTLAGGWTLPMSVLRRRVQRRYNEIEFALPELIDLLVLTVEAGIGFNAALHLSSTRIKGALGDELRLTLQEQSLGLSTHDALTNMLARSDTISMRSFVRSVIQGEALGVSIGQILRNLASEMRKRRKQLAEERAQKAPVKILFPLIFLIFPPIFVVLLYPAVHTFKAALGG